MALAARIRSHRPPARLPTTNCRLLVFLRGLWLLIRKHGGLGDNVPASILPGICFSQGNAAAEALSCELSPARDRNPGKRGRGNGFG